MTTQLLFLLIADTIWQLIVTLAIVLLSKRVVSLWNQITELTNQVTILKSLYGRQND